MKIAYLPQFQLRQILVASDRIYFTNLPLSPPHPPQLGYLSDSPNDACRGGEASSRVVLTPPPHPKLGSFRATLTMRAEGGEEQVAAGGGGELVLSLGWFVGVEPGGEI